MVDFKINFGKVQRMQSIHNLSILNQMFMFKHSKGMSDTENVTINRQLMLPLLLLLQLLAGRTSSAIMQTTQLINKCKIVLWGTAFLYIWKIVHIQSFTLLFEALTSGT